MFSQSSIKSSNSSQDDCPSKDGGIFGVILTPGAGCVSYVRNVEPAGNGLSNLAQRMLPLDLTLPNDCTLVLRPYLC